jgi:hypothetical protein
MLCAGSFSQGVGDDHALLAQRREGQGLDIADRGDCAVVAQRGISVWFNTWYKDFYNALQKKDEAAFWQLILYFCAIAAVAIVGAVYRLYLTQMLTIRWRAWLTEKHFSRWLADKNYYQLEQGGYTDNPDQRISEDLNNFTSNTLSWGSGCCAISSAWCRSRSFCGACRAALRSRHHHSRLHVLVRAGLCRGGQLADAFDRSPLDRPEQPTTTLRSRPAFFHGADS